MESWVLILPLLAFFLLVVAASFACFRKWKVAICFLLVTLMLNWYGELLALHPFASLFTLGDEDDIKVMTFNINGSGDDFKDNVNGIKDLISKVDPDILFLCELFTPYNNYDEKLDSVLQQQYPYSTFKEKMQRGNTFYSKYPIDSVEIVGITIGKSLPLVTLNAKGKYLTFLGCHLSSNNYVDQRTKLEADSVSNGGEAIRYFKTIEKGYSQRKRDVDSISWRISDIDNSHLIIVGDMNDIGGSYTIRKLQSFGLRDAWWRGGLGLGGTRNVLGFPFRIDHILYGEGLELRGAKVIDTDNLSDHNAVVAKLRIH